MRVTDEGLAFIKKREGLRLKAYPDRGGVWTIGYGDTHAVKAGDVITLEEAEERFRKRISEFERATVRVVARPMTAPQFDALVSLVYNIGADAFAGSELLRRFNANDLAGAAREFARWVHVREPNETVLRRGDKGALVMEWQRELKRAGLEVVVDGDFGGSTELATRAYQQRKGIPCTGTGLVRRKVIDADLVNRRVWEIVRFLQP